MQTAHIHVALGNDKQNIVPKYDVTAAEIAVLQQIHGMDAVHEILPQGDIIRANREELARLHFVYGRAKDHENKSIVENMFPGKGARVFETLSELELSETQFAAVDRYKVAKADEPEEIEAVEETEEVAPVVAKEKKAKKAAPAMPEETNEDAFA